METRHFVFDDIHFNTNCVVFITLLENDRIFPLGENRVYPKNKKIICQNSVKNMMKVLLQNVT